MTVGSPQGAILSTTIFIILVADVGLWSKSNITSYADDTTASLSNTDIDKGHAGLVIALLYVGETDFYLLY